MRDCNQCGKCCLKYGGGNLVATTEEIEHWEMARPEIFAYVNNGEIWCSPATGEVLERCPWLEGDTAPYSCAIYFDRPEDCRSYPAALNDMLRDECEMIEVKDRQDLVAARIRLLVFR